MDPALFVVWLVAGVIAGWFTGKIEQNRDPKAVRVDIVVGVIGAEISGLLYHTFNPLALAPGANALSSVTALIGGILLVLAVDWVRHRKFA